MFTQMSVSIQEMELYLQALVGKVPFHASRTVDNWLLIKFKQDISDDGQSQYKSVLRVYAPWLIKSPSEALATWTSKQIEVENALSKIAQCKFVSYAITPAVTYDTVFSFEDKTSLRIFAISLGEVDSSTYFADGAAWVLDMGILDNGPNQMVQVAPGQGITKLTKVE